MTTTAIRTTLAAGALALAGLGATAEEVRDLDAHEHGVGVLNIAIEGSDVAMEFEAPGADIVGFEHAAESAEDRKAVEAAIETLRDPLALFVVPDAAGCTVSAANVSLVFGDEHGEEEHAGEAHAGEAHAGEEHAGEEHAGEAHAGEAHAGEEHAGEAGHSEFQARYVLSCTSPADFTDLEFAYFETFPNAQEVEVNVVDDAGARAFAVDRDAPSLSLGTTT